MSDADGDQEPSMEEILASIRKIISEDVDDGEEEAVEAPAEAVAGPEPEPEPEPMELVDEAEEEPEPLELMEEVEEEEPEPLELMEEVEEEEPLDLVEEVEDLDEIELVDDDDDEDGIDDFEDDLPPPPPPPPPSPPVAMIADSAIDRIVSDSTAASGTASFAHLENTIRMGNAGETLEDIVKGMLQPMLRGWLDENLPGLVERLVQEEIRKMAGVGKKSQDRDFD